MYHRLQRGILTKPTLGARLNLAHWSMRGLIGLWLLNEGAGVSSANLLGGNCAPATLTCRSTGSPPTWDEGPFSNANAVKFANAGTNSEKASYIDLTTSASVKNLATLSVVVWAKQLAFPTTDAFLYYESTGSTTNLRTAFYQPDNTGVVYATMRTSDGGTRYSTASIALTLGKWFQLVLTYTGTTLSFYKNGLPVGTATTDGNPTSSATPTAGCRLGAVGSDTFNDGEGFNGVIDHCFILNTCLTASQVLALYQDPFCMFPRLRPGL